MGIPSSSSLKSSGVEETVAGSTSANFSGSAVEGGEVAGGSSEGGVAADAIGRPVEKTGKGGSGGCSKSGVEDAIGGSGPVATSGSGGGGGGRDIFAFITLSWNFGRRRGVKTE